MALEINVSTPPRHYLPDTKVRDMECTFELIDGGIGDYICYVPALKYIAEMHPQIRGHVYTSVHMVELVAHFLKPYPKWIVHTPKEWEEFRKNEVMYRSRPLFTPQRTPLNATGAHPLDLGFSYYVGSLPPPEEYNWYPTLHFEKTANDPLPEKYAVMTPGSTTENRKMRAHTFNGIKDHLIAKGVTPVFLGQKHITDIRQIAYDKDYDFSNGIDLREKTTLLEAAYVISRAKLIVGLDNGLLHLAACTETPIIFGYNIAAPIHRRPRRRSGKIWEIYPDEKELPCVFCQSNMRFAFGHDFAMCMYHNNPERDSKCLDAIGDPKIWAKLIDDVLEKT